MVLQEVEAETRRLSGARGAGNVLLERGRPPPLFTYCLYRETSMPACSRIATRTRASGNAAARRSAISLLS